VKSQHAERKPSSVRQSFAEATAARRLLVRESRRERERENKSVIEREREREREREKEGERVCVC
jgi:hypothetical protein